MPNKMYNFVIYYIQKNTYFIQYSTRNIISLINRPTIFVFYPIFLSLLYAQIQVPLPNTEREQIKKILMVDGYPKYLGDQTLETY